MKRHRTPCRVANMLRAMDAYERTCEEQALANATPDEIALIHVMQAKARMQECDTAMTDYWRDTAIQDAWERGDYD